MSRPGLKKVVKTVRGKRGSVRRSYWVRAGNAPKRTVRPAAQHGPSRLGQVAGMALAAAPVIFTASKAARFAWQNRAAAQQMFKLARHDFAGFRRGTGGELAQHLLNQGGQTLTGMAGGHIGSRIGGTIGGMVGGGGGAMVGSWLGEHAGGFLASKYGSGHAQRLADAIGTRIRR